MLMAAPTIMYMLSLILLPIYLFTAMFSSSFVIEWEILNISSMKIELELMLDWSGILYSAIVMFISSHVLTFSKTYMAHDMNKLRFTYTVMCFITSMNILIFIPNMICMLIGWDGLGITSFILVMYYNNARSLSASMLTMLTNRLGDTFLLLSIATMANLAYWTPTNYTQNKLFQLQYLGIMVAALTKSAQLPFSSWLPAAMAAPTPVSALVHSSTLVTAGVFIMYRFNNLIHNSPLMQTTILITSMSTAMMAGMSAMYETDMKKVIALSTLSQLGLMMFPLSLSLPMLTFFHMTMHALFKALLFIAAGNHLLMNNHAQDLRFYGQFMNTTPLIKSSMLMSLTAMIGIPFMSGYYSKHAILQWSSNIPINYLLWTIMMVTITITSIYSLRLFLLTMLTTPSSTTINHEYLKISPLTHMSLMSVISGTALQWLNPTPTTMNTNINLSLTINIIISMSIILLIITLTSFQPTMLKFNTSMMFLTPMSTQLFLPLTMLSTQISKFLDQSWLEQMSALSMQHMMNMSSTLENNTKPAPINNVIKSSVLSALFMWSISIFL